MHWISLKLCTSSGQNLNCSWAGIIHDGLSLAFQKGWYKKIQNNSWLFKNYLLTPEYSALKSQLTFTLKVLTGCTLFKHCLYYLILLVIYEWLNSLKMI
jgi:hypothetical protein